MKNEFYKENNVQYQVYNVHLKKKLQLKCWFTNHNKWNVACALLSKFCIDITTNK